MQKLSRFLSLLILIAALLPATQRTSAGGSHCMIYTHSGRDAYYASLQEALDDPLLDPNPVLNLVGVCKGAEARATISKPVRIFGQSTELKPQPTLDGMLLEGSPVITITGNISVTFTDLMLTGAEGLSALEIFSATVMLTNTQFISNTRALYAKNAQLSGANLILAHNDNGLLLEGTSRASITHATIHNTGIGATLNGYSTLQLKNSIISGNTYGTVVHTYAAFEGDNTLWWANGTNMFGTGTIHHRADYQGNPFYVEADGGDYDITSLSAACNRGNASWGSAYDIANKPRDAEPDLGAFEGECIVLDHHVNLPLISLGTN